MMEYDFSEDIWFEKCSLCNATIEGNTKALLLSFIDRHNKSVHNNKAGK